MLGLWALVAVAQAGSDPLCTESTPAAAEMGNFDLLPGGDICCKSSVGEWPMCCASAEGATTKVVPIIGSPGTQQGIIYLILLLYSFMGVAIVADTFMVAIEVITSKEKQKTITDADGQPRVLRVKLWNDTVANLTLMALGSSAPEILLSVIELFDPDPANFMQAGALGPSVVVGSAAFNLFVISAVCVVCIPEGEKRFVQGVKVYAITATCSVWAYVWLIVILLVTSPHKVDIWEGVVTFLMFPVLVGLAYAVDAGMLFAPQRERQEKALYALESTGESVSPQMLAEIRKEIKEEYMQALPEEAIMKLVVARIEDRKPKSRARRRIEATRQVAAGKKISTAVTPDADVQRISITPAENELPTLGFECVAISCLECVEHLRLVVERSAKTLDVACSVSYITRDGDGSLGNIAKAGEDYIHKEGTLEFKVGEDKKEIEVKIVDDIQYEEDEHFFIDLFDVKCEKKINLDASTQRCTVTVIDDDEPGNFQFQKDEYTVMEGKEEFAVLTVERKNGSSGEVSCKYKTEDISTTEGVDYEPVAGAELVFNHSETVKQIKIKIIDDEHYEKKESFRVRIYDAKGGSKFTSSTQGGDEYGESIVYILNDDKTAGAVDAIRKHLAITVDSHRVGSSNWGDQFREAIYPGGSAEEAKNVAFLSYDFLIHVLNFPFKFIFAAIPPTDYAGGWICFNVALLFIGAVTVIVGETANLLGCAILLESEITAITFVALGTSLPDTFASKTAAVQDPYADASIGNVTGSNSVNVFLGLGLPWMIGALYWASNWDVAEAGAIAEALTLNMEVENTGTPTFYWMTKNFKLGNYFDHYYLGESALVPEGGFIVPAGSLGFSVTVFSTLAIICIGFLAWRRMTYGGELGGETTPKKISGMVLVSFWFMYIGLSIMKIKNPTFMR